MGKESRMVYRWNKLIDDGFTTKEADELCKVPFYVPYMSKLRDERREEYDNAKSEYRAEHKKSLPADEWEKQVKESYTDKEFIHPETGEYDPWQLLRSYQHDWTDTHPDYESP